MLLQTRAELSPAEILHEAARQIEVRVGLERERNISCVLAAARVWRDDSRAYGDSSKEAADAYKMLEMECRRVIR